MASHQSGLTIITAIEEGREEALKAFLVHEIMERDVETNPQVPFAHLTRVHFARWVVLDASTDALGRPTPASLVFSTNFDEPVQEHLDELLNVAGPGIERIYDHCKGFPPPGERARDAVLAYLHRHRVGYNTLYIGTRGRTVEQIRQEAQLRDALQGYLDCESKRRDFAQEEVGAIREDLQRFVREHPDLQWAQTPAPEPKARWPKAKDTLLLGALVLIVGALIVLGIVTSVWIALLTFVVVVGITALLVALMLRYKEGRDREAPASTDASHVRDLVRQEDFIVQNQLSSITNVKPGWFRRMTLRTVLYVIDLAGRYIYTKGRLGTIPTIHYARWVMVDGGRRLLFFSNFDGSWENYLGDFIDKAASGLTAVWSNTDGFPKTRWLTRDGATDEQRFKAYTRTSQAPTQVWYSAYKRLTVTNINNNSAIRAGLYGNQTPSETEAWLRRL